MATQSLEIKTSIELPVIATEEELTRLGAEKGKDGLIRYNNATLGVTAG
ncbi:hypothetical protein HYT24_01100, partial [Candidatus Pacearchaeota archaeon]|nr:hypothetical protein [Candidatus Pacearchaeota archaeon]